MTQELIPPKMTQKRYPSQKDLIGDYLAPNTYADSKVFPLCLG